MIEIKNIFQHYNLRCFSYNKTEENIYVGYYLRQTSKRNIMNENIIKAFSTANKILKCFLQYMLTILKL